MPTDIEGLSDEELVNAICRKTVELSLGPRLNRPENYDELCDEAINRMSGARWVSVEHDGPPDHDGYVLVSDGELVQAGFYEACIDRFQIEMGIPPEEITHWRELPDPPNPPEEG